MNIRSPMFWLYRWERGHLPFARPQRGSTRWRRRRWRRCSSSRSRSTISTFAKILNENFRDRGPRTIESLSVSERKKTEKWKWTLQIWEKEHSFLFDGRKELFVPRTKKLIWLSQSHCPMRVFWLICQIRCLSDDKNKLFKWRFLFKLTSVFLWI